MCFLHLILFCIVSSSFLGDACQLTVTGLSPFGVLFSPSSLSPNSKNKLWFSLLLVFQIKSLFFIFDFCHFLFCYIFVFFQFNLSILIYDIFFLIWSIFFWFLSFFPWLFIRTFMIFDFILQIKFIISVFLVVVVVVEGWGGGGLTIIEL
jgi:hypothetical protein